MLKRQVDIAFLVALLSQYLTNSGFANIKAVMKIIQYLGRTIWMYFTFRERLKQLVRYTDPNWIREIKTQRSISEFFFNIRNAAISWSLKQ